MRGVGRSSAAISIVNALPTGIGCAHGVRLYAAVTVELAPEGPARVDVRPETSRTPLVVRSLEAALAQFRPGGELSAHVDVDSEIPVAKGLKSSSAVATATIRAVADAVAAETDPIEIARLAAAVGREVGVSATGAFDDALAGLLPGFILTDNRSGQLISRSPADPEWTAVVHVPKGTHPRSPAVAERFRAFAAEGEAAARAARRGKWDEAMDRNSRIVERAMGYEYDGLRRSLLHEGAVACGVSGLGPALVALVPRSRAERVIEALPPERFVVPLTSEDHP